MIIRWTCEKCSKKWIYPVQKCLYCKGPIAKQKSTRAKIIGVTKVNIPSPMHPIIPYNIILLEDEWGNRMPKKTMKSHRIGESYEVEPAKTGNAVVITKIKYDLEEALFESFGLLNSPGIKPEDKVLIKVSCIESAYPYQAVCTNPALLAALIKALKEMGVTDIVVGEQATLGNDTMDAASKSGILDVCKKNSITFVDLGKGEFVEKKGDVMSYQVARDAIERKVIDVPVLKTHSQLTIAGAMENLIRVCSSQSQKEMYSKGIEKSLPDLSKAISPALVIGDGTIGLHANGPTSLGEPAFLNLLLIGKDAPSVDRVFTEIGMFQAPDYLKQAAGDIRRIEAVNYEVDASKFQLKQPRKGSTAHPNIHLIDGSADPYVLNTALKMAQKLVGLGGDDVHLVIGSHLSLEMMEDKRRLVLYGKDAIRKGKEMGIEAVAELTEEMPDIQRVVFLKSILENPDKKKLGIADTFKAKLAMFSQKKK